MSGQTITCVLIDDHAIVRQGLRSLLEREDDIDVVGDAADGQSALQLIASALPHVAVLDLKLSARSDTEGLDLCSTIVSNYPGVAVLILTTFLDEALIIDAIRRGAKGYVVKDVDTSAVVSAIRELSAGRSYFDGRSSTAIIRGIHSPDEPAENTLTSRELEVLELVAAGMSNRQIGEALFISSATAKFHVGNILRKLGATRRTEAVHTAGKLGLL